MISAGRIKNKTNYIFEKLSAAGIEVITNKNEYQWMLEQIDEINITLDMFEEKPLQMQFNEKKEIGNLSTSNNDTLTRSQSLNSKIILDSSNSQEFITNLISLEKEKQERFINNLDKQTEDLKIYWYYSIKSNDCF